MSHHSPQEPAPDWIKQLRQETKPGPTHDFPDGKVHRTDEGGIRVAIGSKTDENIVFMDFGGPVAWIGFTKIEAMELSRRLLEHARNIT